MNPKLNELLEQANQVYPGTVMTRVGQNQDGLLRMDRAEQSALADRLLIEVPDQTEADFVLGNELLQLVLTLNGITPQIYFALTFNDEDLDQQLITIATRLHRTVLHAITYQELAKQGFLTADTVTAFLAGVKDELSVETANVDGEDLFRLLTVLDAQVFLVAADKAGLSDLAADAFATLKEDYPRATAQGEKLVAPILAANLKDSRQIRKQMVRLFTGMDESLTELELPTVKDRKSVV